MGESLVPELKANSFTKVSFKIRLRGDWTSQTTITRAVYFSLWWTPLNDSNYEVIAIRWLNKSLDPKDFFEKLLRQSLIYRLRSLKKVYSNIYIASFLGPREKTVRSALLRYRVPFYSSRIDDGWQIWEVILQDDKIKGFLEFLTDLGQLEMISINSINEVPELFNPYLSLAYFLLSAKELKTIKIALEKGYFNKERNVNMEILAKILGKNKSTVERELRNAMNKIINIVFTRNLEE